MDRRSTSAAGQTSQGAYALLSSSRLSPCPSSSSRQTSCWPLLQSRSGILTPRAGKKVKTKNDESLGWRRRLFMPTKEATPRREAQNSRDRTTVREALLGGFVCPMAHVAVALRAILGEFLPLASVLCLWARNLVGLLQPGLTAGRHHDNPSLDPG